MGHCRHEWQARSEQLRAVFNGIERVTHEFLVCGRCLKIREIEAGEGQGRQAKGRGSDEGSGANAA